MTAKLDFVLYLFFIWCKFQSVSSLRSLDYFSVQVKINLQLVQYLCWLGWSCRPKVHWKWISGINVTHFIFSHITTSLKSHIMTTTTKYQVVRFYVCWAWGAKHKIGWKTLTKQKHNKIKYIYKRGNTIIIQNTENLKKNTQKSMTQRYKRKHLSHHSLTFWEMLSWWRSDENNN